MSSWYPKGFEKVSLKDQHSGLWKIETFEVSEEAARMDSLRASIKGHNRQVPAGKYTALKHAERGVVMSDTPAEAWDHNSIYKHAHGKVLLNGLGIGFVLKAILSKPEVEHVTVIEISEDVIKMVKPFYEYNSVEIIHHDALKFKPTQYYDTVWHDIWDNITSDNLEEMKFLHRKFGRRSGWQGSWARSLCERCAR